MLTPLYREDHLETKGSGIEAASVGWAVIVAISAQSGNPVYDDQTRMNRQAKDRFL
jgi:hypothetical protein